ncbi:MAG: DMT family transporter [Candidatus Aminicenantes bacterium]|nr:MAG: DMT family transporter [Candidatus Aminicenantes bacterium]
MMSVYGEIAALLTAVCWAFNSVVFTQAGKRIGATNVNHMRLWIAVVAMIVLHTIRFGTPFPFDIETHRLLYLGISGIIGLVIGDGFLFESFLLIGPRLATLLMLLTPVFSAILAWVFLGEVLLVMEIIGILVTMGGIAWVVAEKTPPVITTTSKKPYKYALGIALGICGAVGQAVGLLFSRLGLEGDYSTISANHVRVTFAAVALALVLLVQGKMHTHFVKMKDKKALVEITSGALTGPVLGVILSLEAIAHTHIGTASTLMSLSPVLLIPVSHFLYKEKITFRAIIGTIIALVGVALLFFK